eukprot:1921436-Alexandrium_andersonii.AAC.1
MWAGPRPRGAEEAGLVDLHYSARRERERNRRSGGALHARPGQAGPGLAGPGRAGPGRATPG